VQKLYTFVGCGCCSLERLCSRRTERRVLYEMDLRRHTRLVQPQRHNLARGHHSKRSMDRRGVAKLPSPSARIAQSKRCVAPVESMAQIWGATSLVPPLEITSGRPTTTAPEARAAQPDPPRAGRPCPVRPAPRGHHVNIRRAVGDSSRVMRSARPSPKTGAAACPTTIAVVATAACR
jgi:hypothetical protein